MMQKPNMIMKLYKDNLLKEGWSQLLVIFISCELMAKTRLSECQIRQGGSKTVQVSWYKKNLPERGNSPDLYNSDNNMATIIELVNAIDGFVDNRAMHIDIISDQIKRTTRQIRQKYNALQQDLVCEQRRRYDAEAECDNEIIRRQLAEGAMDRVVGDLQ